MDVIYINLDRATDRRAATEASFAAHNRLGWKLHRQAAVDKQTIGPTQYGTRISQGLKGLALSHRAAVTWATRLSGHVMIAEDDIQFGPTSLEVIEAAIRGARPDSWDILFTDVCIPDPVTMMQLLRLKKTNGDNVALMDLRAIPFAGTTGLIINAAAKSKYLALIRSDEHLFSLPIDLLIRQFVLHGLIRAHCIFPFPTSLSEFSESSEIQAAGDIDNLLWNAFRKAIWLHADRDAAANVVNRVPENCYDPDALLLGKIIAGRLTRSIQIENETKAKAQPSAV